MKSTLPAIFLLLIAACSMRGNGVTNIFDLGLVSASGEAPALDVSIADIEAPQWLDTTDMHYRLLWRDRQSLQPFSESRWAGPPAAMLTLRLRQALNSSADHSARARCVLRVRLDEFSQVFSSASSSHAMLQVQATLGVRGEPERTLSRSWHIEKRADSANASSGAAALAAATHELTQLLRSWMQQYCAI